MFNVRNRFTVAMSSLLVVFLVVLAVAFIPTVMGSVRSSPSFEVPWDVLDGGGGSGSSASFIIEDSVGQSSPIGESESPNYKIYAGFQVLPTRSFRAVMAGVADYPGIGNDLKYADDDAMDMRNSLYLFQFEMIL